MTVAVSADTLEDGPSRESCEMDQGMEETEQRNKLTVYKDHQKNAVLSRWHKTCEHFFSVDMLGFPFMW